MKQKHNLKKTLNWEELNIELYEYDRTKKEVGYNSVSNIIATNSKGDVIWKVEAPKSHYDQYYDMYLDTTEDLLIAITGSSYKHLINLENGKIIEFYLIK